MSRKSGPRFSPETPGQAADAPAAQNKIARAHSNSFQSECALDPAGFDRAYLSSSLGLVVGVSPSNQGRKLRRVRSQPPSRSFTQ